MKILVAVALATAALAVSTTVAPAQSGADVVPMTRNAAGQPVCPGNYMLQGNVCVSINAGRPGGPDTVPLARNGAGQPVCPGNFAVQGNLCVNIHAKRTPDVAPGGAAGFRSGQRGGHDGGSSREGYRDGYRGYRDDRGYRRDDHRGYRREGYDDRDYRRGRDDYDRGPPRRRTAVEPYLSPRGEWVCPPNYMFRGNVCVSAY